jgi:hypothetical protein
MQVGGWIVRERAFDGRGACVAMTILWTMAPPSCTSELMQLSDGIRRHGFRKWYERELLQSHAHLALTFLCAVGLFAAIEAAMHFTSWSDRVIDALAILACAAIGVWALRRYLFLLMHAEHVANQADCPHCGTYARFTLVEVASASGVLSVTVRCRECAHQWSIDT